MYPAVAATVMDQVKGPGASGARSLTAREQQILKHIVEGETNPQIAAALSLSIKTVDWHRANLMSKLDLHTVADLVRYALQNGLAD